MSAPIRLGFARIVCQRCHAQRIRGVACPDCQETPQPWEVDPNRTRRRQVAERVRAIIQDPTLLTHLEHEPVLTEPPDLLELLPDWLAHFLEALAGDFSDPGTELRLTELAEILRKLRGATVSATRLRPWIAVWRATDVMLGHINDAVDSYLTTLGAETPLAAQIASRQAQKAIDSAAAERNSLFEKLQRTRRIFDIERVEDVLPTVAAEAYGALEHTGLLSLEEAGADDYQRLVGEHCPRGVGVAVRLLSVLAETALDEPRFWETVRASYHRLTSNPDRLAALAQDAIFVADFREARTKTYDSAVVAHAVLAQTRPSRQVIRALLTQASDFLEGPGKRHIALQLAMEGKDYSRVRRKDAGEILRQARDRGLAPLLGGLDETLRHARAHEDFRVEGDLLVVLDRGLPHCAVEPISIPVLADRVLEATETVLALDLALTAATEAAGFSLIDAAHFQRIGLSDADIVAFMLELAGWTGSTSQLEGQWLKVHCAHRPPIDPLQAFVALMPYIPSHIQRFELTGPLRLTGPVAPWRCWATLTGLSKEIAFLEAGQQWTIDEHPYFTPELTVQWLVKSALEAKQLGYPAAVRPLRQLRDMARRVDQTDVASAIEQLITSARS